MTVTITHGDSAIGRPIETSWQAANGDTIVVRTYKATSGQSSADWKAAHDTYFAAAWADHPPA